MTAKEIIVRLHVEEEVDDWGDGDVSYSYRLLNKFDLVSTDIDMKHWQGIGESWAQSDRYYEVIQNLVEVFDDV